MGSGIAATAGDAGWKKSVVTQHAETKHVHQRIALVAVVEVNLARNGRDAEAIPVMRDASHDAGEEPAGIGDLWFAICDFGLGSTRRWRVQRGGAPRYLSNRPAL